MAGIILGRAVGHLDQQPARTLDQQGQGMVRGDQMRIDAEPQQTQPVFKVVVPHRLVPLEQLFAAPYVVDEHIEAALLGADALDQSSNLAGDKVIDPNRDAIAAG